MDLLYSGPKYLFFVKFHFWKQNTDPIYNQQILMDFQFIFCLGFWTEKATKIHNRE